MSPDWIADRGHFSIMVTAKKGGDSRQEVGNYLTLWRKDTDGKWRIYFDIWNTNRPIVDVNAAK
jgi:ketosteroid isomerase-like protein